MLRRHGVAGDLGLALRQDARLFAKVRVTTWPPQVTHLIYRNARGRLATPAAKQWSTEGNILLAPSPLTRGRKLGVNQATAEALQSPQTCPLTAQRPSPTRSRPRAACRPAGTYWGRRCSPRRRRTPGGRTQCTAPRGSPASRPFPRTASTCNSVNSSVLFVEVNHQVKQPLHRGMGKAGVEVFWHVGRGKRRTAWSVPAARLCRRSGGRHPPGRPAQRRRTGELNNVCRQTDRRSTLLAGGNGGLSMSHLGRPQCTLPVHEDWYAAAAVTHGSQQFAQAVVAHRGAPAAEGTLHDVPLFEFTARQRRYSAIIL